MYGLQSQTVSSEESSFSKNTPTERTKSAAAHKLHLSIFLASIGSVLSDNAQNFVIVEKKLSQYPATSCRAHIPTHFSNSAKKQSRHILCKSK